MIGGYYEVEIAGANREERVLQVYGEAWECLESPKIVGSATALVCRFARIERVIEKLGPHVPSFSRLRRLTLGDNALHSLKQVLALAPAIALSHVTELHITNNPVCELVLPSNPLAPHRPQSTLICATRARPS